VMGVAGRGVELEGLVMGDVIGPARVNVGARQERRDRIRHDHRGGIRRVVARVLVQEAGLAADRRGRTRGRRRRAKPPWNQPQVTPLAFSRSPMFRLPVWAVGSLFISSVVVDVWVPPASLPQSSR